MSIEFEEIYRDYYNVFKDEELICDFYRSAGKSELHVNQFYDSFPKLTSAELRQIADKLDELNNAK